MTGQCLKVLMVEDNPADIDLFWSMLDEVSSRRIELTKCETLGEARLVLEEKDYDAVLLDLNLPDSRGLETFRRLHGWFPLIPMVVLSGLDDEATAIEAVREGAQDYLVKWLLSGPLIIRALEYSIERKKTETALKNSEERLRVLFDKSPDAMYLQDLEGRFVDANQAAFELLGYPSGQALNRTSFELNLLPKGKRRRAVEEFNRAVRGEPVGPSEYTLTRPDGTKAPVEVRIHPVDVSGRRMILGVARDLTAWKRAEELRRESEEKFRVAFEKAAVGMCLTGLDGRLLKVNRAMGQMLGYAEQELTSLNFAAITHPDDLALSQEVVNSLVKGEQEGRRFEKRYFSKDGGIVWADVSTFLHRDFNNEPLFMITHIQDITARKQAEEALRRAHDELEQKVAERTAALAKANEHLQTEIQDRRRAVMALRIANRALLALSACNQAMVRSTSEEDLIEEVCRIMVEVGGYQNAWVGYVEPGPPQRIVPVRQGGVRLAHLENGAFEVIENESGGCPAMAAALTGRPALSNNVSFEENIGPCRREAIEKGFASVLAVPLKYFDKVFGILAVYSDQVEAFDDEEKNLLLQMADDLTNGIFIHRARAEQRRVEEQLWITSNAMSSSLNAISLADLTGRITYVNQSCLKMWGYGEPAEVVGRPVAEFWDDQGELAVVVKAVMGGQGWQGEMTGRRRDGSTFPAQVTTSLVKGQDGSPACVMASLLDVTEKRRAEENLRKSEEKFRTLFNSAGDAMFILDLEGHFLEVNDAACRRLGYSREELLRMTPVEINAPEYRNGVADRIGQVVREEAMSFESVHVARNGTHIPVEVNSRVFSYEGQPVILSAARDITERVQAQRDLQESEARYRLLVETMRDGLGIINEEAVLTYVND
ncbi:MAG: PAS domain S-box protein, partial [Thermodesulfobacteriota bacterium]